MKTLALQPKNNSHFYSFIIAAIIYAILATLLFAVDMDVESKNVGVQQSIAISINQFQQQTRPPIHKQITKEQIHQINEIKRERKKPKKIHKKQLEKTPQQMIEQPQIAPTKEYHTNNIQQSQIIQNTKEDTFVFGKDNNPFLIAVKKSIDQNLQYPRKARMMRTTGIVTVKFTILNNGNIKDIVVLKSSGHKILDYSALKTILKASHNFPKPKRDTTIQIPIQYKLI